MSLITRSSYALEVLEYLQGVEQIAFADVILMNKSDLVSVGDRKRVAARIKVNILLCQLNGGIQPPLDQVLCNKHCSNKTQHNDDLQDAYVCHPKMTLAQNLYFSYVNHFGLLAACMQGINGTAEIIQTTNSDVDLEKIIGRNAFSLQKILDMEPDFLKVSSTGTLHSLPIACSLPDSDCKLRTLQYCGTVLFKELVIL